MKTLHTFFLLFAVVLAKAQTPTIIFDNVTKTYGDAPFYMTASSNSSGSFMYSVLNTDIASIDQSGFLTIKKGGSTTVTVTQAASAPYLAASKTSILTVNKATVFAVNITSANTVYANDSLSLTASSNFADAKYTFSIKSQSGTNATINGTKLFAGSNTGTLDIIGDVVADANFNAGTVSSTNAQTITVQASSGTPELVFENKTVSFGTAPFNMAAISNSPAPISFSIDSGTVATISANGLVTILGVGIVKIKASQVAVGGFLSVSKTTILTVNKAVVSSLSITSSNTVEVNDSISLTATSNPPGASFKWSLVSQNGTNSTIKGAKLYAGAVTGNLEVKAEVLADANFTSSPTSSTLSQTISVTNANYQIPNLVFNDYTYSYSNDYEYLYATSNSYGARTFSLLSGTAATVTSDGKLTKLGLGKVVVQVTQAAYPPYKSVSKTASFTIVKSTPSPYFEERETYLPYINDTTRLANTNDTISFATYANYGNPKLEFSILNQNGTNATLTGNKLYSGSNTGTLTLMLKAVGDDFNYESTFKRTIIIGTPQVSEMTFKDTSIVYGQSGFRLLANSNNQYGTIQYSLVSGNAAIIYAYGEVVIKGAGSVIVKATQSAYPPFAAVSKTAVLTIQKATPVITITSRDDVRWNDSLLLTAASNPTGAKIKWSILSQNGTNATIIGNKLFAGSQRGTFEIKAIVESDSNFYPASSEKVIIGVDSIIKSTIIVNDLINNVLYNQYGAAPFYATATSNSSGAFSYSVANDSVVTISPTGLVTIVKPGIAIVTISQAATPTYKATTKSFVLQIKKVVPLIKITSANTINVSDSLNLTAISIPVGAKIKWTVSSQSGTNSTIVGSKLYAGTSVGFLDIRAEVVPDDYFAYGYVGTSTNGYSSSAYQQIAVNSTSGTPTIYFPNSENNYVCGKNCTGIVYKMTASSNSLGAFTYRILDEPSASINSNGVITFKNLDSLLTIIQYYNFKLTVQATQEAYPPYNSVSKTAIFAFQLIITELENSNSTFSKPTAYPNPAKDILQIRSGKGAGCEATISLYNMNGEVQNATSIKNGDDYQVDISELSSGIYSLKMTFCNEVFTQKVVKQ